MVYLPRIGAVGCIDPEYSEFSVIGWKRLGR